MVGFVYAGYCQWLFLYFLQNAGLFQKITLLKLYKETAK